MSREPTENISRRHLSTLLEISGDLASSLNLPVVLQTAIGRAVATLELDTGAIYLLEGADLYLGATTPPLPSEFPEELRHAHLVDHPHIGESVATSNAIVLEDALAATLTPAEQVVVETRNLRTVLYLPLLVEAKVVGVIILGTTGEVRRFSDEDMVMSRMLAYEIALATENALVCASLQRSEERFRGLVEATSDFIWEVNEESVFTYVNPQIERLLGYTPEEVVGRTPFDLMLPEEAARAAETFEGCLESAEPIVMFENVNVHKDGHHVIFETSGVPILDAAGNVCGYRGIDRDVTARKRAEQQLQTERQQTRSYLDCIEAIVVALDAEGRITFINRAGAEILEAVGANLIGEDWFARFIPSESSEPVRETFSELMNGEPRSVEYFGNDIVTTTGEKRRIEWHNAIRHEGGHIIGTLSYGMDVTEHRRTEQELTQAQEQYRNTFEKAAVGVVNVSPDGRFLRANAMACSILGREADELLGLTFQEITFPEDLDVGVEYIRDVVAEKRDTAIIEKRYVRPDGSLLWARLTAAPVRDDNGELKYLVSIMEDITERKRLDAELRDLNENLEALVEERTEETTRANRAKSAFLASMSHELRTPLNSIIGFSRILLDGMAGEVNQEQQRQLGMIQESGKRLLALVNDILDLSKIEAEAVSVEAHETNANTVCSAAVEQVRPQAEEKGIELRFSPCAEECSHCGQVMVDRDKLTQVVLNLLSNALKFTKAGSVECRVECAGEKTMSIKVTDTGVGIEKDALERIFGEFEQISFEDEAKPQGTGLGLSISRKLADLLGGNLTVTSTPGSGSEFTLELPLRLTDDHQE